MPYGYGQEQVYARKTKDLLKTIKKYHYQPPPIDDSLSQLIFTKTLENLDPVHLLFTKEDIEQLSSLQLQIDDDLKLLEFNFPNLVLKLHLKRIASTKLFLESLDVSQLDFTEQDELALINEWNDESNLNQRWINFIKLNMLNAYFSNEDGVEKDAQDFTEKQKELFEEARQNVICKLESFDEQLDDFESYIFEMFLVALTQSFDPHSLYFSASDAEHFLEELMSSSFSFGIELSPNHFGDLEITNIVPGGPAWMSNKLNEGDVIIGAKDEEGLYYDFNCANSEDILNIFRTPAISSIEFSIRKKNGEEFKLQLEKDFIDVDDNTIRSFILSDESKVAYIYLPSFYTAGLDDFYMGPGCSKDLATELIKLKKDGVQGLILDLRNNGGGSMAEAIKCAGIFVNHGAVAIGDLDGELETLKDKDRGQLFREPVVILINSYSASASELLAASLQDHHRAVIVGSQSYGKASAQLILPIDAHKYSRERWDNSDAKDFVKLTTGAFFRVNGQTHQGEGILPDVSLPEEADLIIQKEKDNNNSLNINPVNKKTYYYPYDELPLTTLRKKSISRRSDNSIFEFSKNDDAKIIKEYTESIPLNFEEFAEYSEEKSLTSNTASSYATNVIIDDPTYIKEIDIIESADNAQLEQIKKDIVEDIYILESYLILQDLIKLIK